uniref:Uncharacterized protein n=1 Tax=Lygus hesperus TaxID=30085 RepID=A0A146KNL9_LYGHE
MLVRQSQCINQSRLSYVWHSNYQANRCHSFVLWSGQYVHDKPLHGLNNITPASLCARKDSKAAMTFVIVLYRIAAILICELGFVKYDKTWFLYNKSPQLCIFRRKRKSSVTNFEHKICVF